MYVGQGEEAGDLKAKFLVQLLQPRGRAIVDGEGHVVGTVADEAVDAHLSAESGGR